MPENSDDIAFATSYPRDMDGLRTFYEVAVEAGRDFVIPTKAAHLLEAFKHDKGIDLPHPGSKSLRVYRRPKKKSPTWEKPFLEDSIDAKWVARHQGDMLMNLDLEHLAELIDIRPKRGSSFIRSRSGPLEENDISDGVLGNRLEHFGVAFHQIHATGHCSTEEAFGAIEEIGPDKVLPVHTEHP